MRKKIFSDPKINISDFWSNYWYSYGRDGCRMVFGVIMR